MPLGPEFKKKKKIGRKPIHLYCVASRLTICQHPARHPVSQHDTSAQFINCCAFYEFTKSAAQFINCANSQIAPNSTVNCRIIEIFLPVP